MYLVLHTPTISLTEERASDSGWISSFHRLCVSYRNKWKLLFILKFKPIDQFFLKFCYKMPWMTNLFIGTICRMPCQLFNYLGLCIFLLGDGGPLNTLAICWTVHYLLKWFSSYELLIIPYFVHLNRQKLRMQRKQFKFWALPYYNSAQVCLISNFKKQTRDLIIWRYCSIMFIDVTSICTQWNHTAHMVRELPLYAWKLVPPQRSILVIQVLRWKYHYE